MATSQDFVNWICGDQLLPRFLQYLLIAEGQGLLRFASGAVHKTIYFPEVKAFHVCVPGVSEQRRIVAILDEAFEGVATAKAHAERNLRNVREVFSSVLANFFPAARAEVALAELAESISDGDHAPPPKAVEGVPFITISNIDKATREIDFADTFLVPRSYFDGLKSHRRPVAGDVLYTVTGSFGIPVLVTGEQEFCFQRHIGLIRPKQTVDAVWLTYALLSPMAFAQADQRATGTAQRTVSLSVLRDLRLPHLPAEEQRRVAEEISAIESGKRELEACLARKIVALDELKQSLLHQAFSGQL
jgi:type I restriction enzyme S subunit